MELWDTLPSPTETCFSFINIVVCNPSLSVQLTFLTCVYKDKCQMLCWIKTNCLGPSNRNGRGTGNLAGIQRPRLNLFLNIQSPNEKPVLELAMHGCQIVLFRIYRFPFGSSSCEVCPLMASPNT